MADVTWLVVCHAMPDLRLLDLAQDSGRRIIVGADAPDVQRAAGRDARVREVVFLDQMVSVFDGIDEVVRMRERINAWLTERTGLDPYLIELIKHAEGGVTTQRIQDVLLLVDSAMRLLTRHRIGAVLVHRRIRTDLEDEILVRCARTLGIDVVERYSWTHRLFARAMPNRVNVSFRGSTRALYLPLAAIMLIRRCIVAANIARTRGKRRHAAPSGGGDLILFLLGSSAPKHVDDAALAMAEFARRPGCHALALSWSEPARVRHMMAARELPAENLEAWATWKDVARALRVCGRARRQADLRSFVRSVPLSYRGVFLSDLLKVSVRYTVQVDLFTRLLMRAAADAFLGVHRPAAVKVWGELRFDLGRVCYESVVSRTGPGACVFFYYPVGVDGGIGYGPPPVDAIDFYFIHGEIDRKWHRIAGERSCQIVSGFSKDTLLRDFRDIDPEDSARVLGLAPRAEGELRVFYASSPVIRGCVSLAEYQTVAESLIGYAAAAPRTTLILKPHPNDSPALFEQIRAKHGNPPNVALLDRTAPVYHCINAADVVVTKYSTVALEAMKLAKPVISVALDGEARFQDIFEDAVAKFQDTASCTALLDALARDPAQRAAWTARRLALQDAFLPRKMYTPPTSSEKIIADTVLEAIARRREARRAPTAAEGTTLGLPVSH